MDVDVEIQLFGLSSYYAAVAAMAADFLIMAVAAATTIIIAAFGLSFSFSSAVADVVVETDSANKL